MKGTCLRVYVTSRCNSRCSYCYRGLGASDPLLDRRQDLDAPGLLRYLDALGDAVGVVKLSGGEPALYPGLASLVRDLRARALKIELYSNGQLTRLSPETLNEFEKIHLSLDSVVPEVNNRSRGDRQSYRAFHDALKCVRSLGKDNLQVQVTVTRDTIVTLKSTLDYLIDELGVDQVKLSEVMRRGDEVAGAAGLDGEQLRHVHGLAMAKRRRRHYGVVVNTTFYRRRSYAVLHGDLKGLVSMFVNQDNDAYFFVGESDVFRIGNTTHDDAKLLAARTRQKFPVAERFAEFAFDVLQRSSDEFVSPGQFLYQTDVIGRFAKSSAAQRVV